MKTLKFLAALLIIAGLAVSNANAQTVSTKVTYDYFSVYIPCTGELAVGSLTLHRLYSFDKDGNLTKFLNQPMGGALVGLTTGKVYRLRGVTQLRTMAPQTYINLFHMVGPGIQFFIKEILHAIINADGELVYLVEKYEVICK